MTTTVPQHHTFDISTPDVLPLVWTFRPLKMVDDGEDEPNERGRRRQTRRRLRCSFVLAAVRNF